MNKLKKMYTAAGILQLICAVLWFVPSCSVVSSYTQNMLGEVSNVNASVFSLSSFFKGAEFLLVASMCGLALSIALMILPVFKSTEEKRRRLIFSKISAMYSLVMFLFFFFFSSSQTNQYVDLGVKTEMKFGGVLLIIVSALLIVLLFKISSETKKIKRNNEIAENSTINE
ncbi:MAG: hypothetical protein IJ447_06885 [Clostridia bacterium]|nr:hypothetical protein [Clostridia bacterium]